MDTKKATVSEIFFLNMQHKRAIVVIGLHAGSHFSFVIILKIIHTCKLFIIGQSTFESLPKTGIICLQHQSLINFTNIES